MSRFNLLSVLTVVFLTLITNGLSVHQVRCDPCRCYNRTFDDFDMMGGANCSGLAIDESKDLYLPPDIQYLDLSNNNLRTFPWRLLLGFSKLNYVDLRMNQITDLCDHSIADVDMDSLVYIDLIGNNITTDCLSLFSDVKTLKLETDDLRNDTLNPVSRIEEFHLVTSKLDLPESLFHPLIAIKTIDLYVKNCVRLPDGLFRSESIKRVLKSLVINGPRLVIENKNLLMDAIVLKHLHLILDNKETVPNDLLYERERQVGHRMKRYYLEEVIIEGVRHLPNELFQYMPNLQYLKVTGLKDVPQNLINSSPYMKVLILTGGEIRSIPSEFFREQKELQYLDLSDNKIKLNGSQLATLVELQHLDLSHNEISTLIQGTFQNSGSSLKFLNLLHNPLCHVPQDLFLSLPALKEFHVDLSCLKSVDGRLFSDLVNVTKATISSADIEDMPDDTFEKMISLRHLKLEDPRLVKYCTSDGREPFSLIDACTEHLELRTAIVRKTVPTGLVPIAKTEIKSARNAAAVTTTITVPTKTTTTSFLHRSIASSSTTKRIAAKRRKLAARTAVGTSSTSRRTTTTTTYTTTAIISRKRKLSVGDRINQRPGYGPWTTFTHTFPDVRTTMLPVTARKTKGPRPLKPVLSPDGFFRPAIRTTRYVPRYTTPPFGVIEGVPSVKNKSGRTSYATSVIKWAVPVGVGFLLLIVLIPIIWGYFQMKRRDQRKRTPSSFGLTDTSYRAFGSFLGAPIDNYSADGRSSSISSFDRSAYPRMSRHSLLLPCRKVGQQRGVAGKGFMERNAYLHPQHSEPSHLMKVGAMRSMETPIVDINYNTSFPPYANTHFVDSIGVHNNQQRWG